MLTQLAENIRRGKRSIDGHELGSLVSLSEREADQVASAFSLIMGLLSESEASVDDFIKSARDILFVEADERVARTIAGEICARREELGGSIERARLAGSILPSFASLNIAVDLRVKVASGKIKTVAPLAVVYIDTDVAESQTWFQMTQADLEGTIKKLTKALEDLKVAATLVPPGV